MRYKGNPNINSPKLIYGLILIFSVLVLTSAVSVTRIKIKLDRTSSFSIHGTSNLKSFCCVSLENFNPKEFEIKFNEKLCEYKFSEGEIILKSKLLDCGEFAITRNMRKTISTKTYPFIKIEPLSFNNQFSSKILLENNVVIPLEANVIIHLAGEEVQILWPFDFVKLDANTFHITATKALNLSNFYIEPENYLFGLIKVNDQIRIDLDLSVHLIK